MRSWRRAGRANVPLYASPRLGSWAVVVLGCEWSIRTALMMMLVTKFERRYVVYERGLLAMCSVFDITNTTTCQRISTISNHAHAIISKFASHPGSHHHIKRQSKRGRPRSKANSCAKLRCEPWVLRAWRSMTGHAWGATRMARHAVSRRTQIVDLLEESESIYRETTLSYISGNENSSTIIILFFRTLRCSAVRCLRHSRFRMGVATTSIISILIMRWSKSKKIIGR